MLPRLTFRGLLSIHSRCGPQRPLTSFEAVSRSASAHLLPPGPLPVLPADRHRAWQRALYRDSARRPARCCRDEPDPVDSHEQTGSVCISEGHSHPLAYPQRKPDRRATAAPLVACERHRLIERTHVKGGMSGRRLFHKIESPHAAAGRRR